MNFFRQIACYGILIFLMGCMILSEQEWLFQLAEVSPDDRSLRLEELEQWQEKLDSVWEELIYFPVPESTAEERAQVSFENTWMAERNFGGTRRHEGIDLMASMDQRGYYPVVSMTDGVIEQIGWLEKGGWRLGIRSEHENYYYYAHLDSYAEEWRKGDPVEAGTLLGYMGDSGYGPEGTVGQFPVHLHVGIYVPLDHDQETAVNPYWMLRYLERKKLSYAF